MDSAPVSGVGDAELPWNEMIWGCGAVVASLSPTWACLDGALPQPAGLKAEDGAVNPQHWESGEISDGHFQYLL